MRKTDLLRFLPDKFYIKFKYFIMFGKRLDLRNPQTFNEKLNWLKIYDHNDIYTQMVDKYLVKKYVEDVIGKEYIIPTLGVYDKFNDIDFNKLPNKFVIKTNHDCGGIVLCNDKKTFDVENARKLITKHLNSNYYYGNREWPYKNVKPRILIEDYMQDDGEGLKDYKFFCFNGKVKFFKIDFNRFIKHQANYFDTDGSLLKFGEVTCPPDFEKKLDIPKNLNKMISLAELLSKNIPFIRVDFYSVKGKIYFGELTLYPAAGYGKFIPPEYDKIIGDYLELPKRK